MEFLRGVFWVLLFSLLVEPFVSHEAAKRKKTYLCLFFEIQSASQHWKRPRCCCRVLTTYSKIFFLHGVYCVIRGPIRTIACWMYRALCRHPPPTQMNHLSLQHSSFYTCLISPWGLALDCGIFPHKSLRLPSDATLATCSSAVYLSRMFRPRLL